jgi:hypothetical protein
MTNLKIPDEKHQSFHDWLKHYVGETDPRFNKLMKGDNGSHDIEPRLSREVRARSVDI